MRGIGASSLTTVDASLLRFGVPALLLLPMLGRLLDGIRREPRAVLALLVLGGLPHFVVSALGAQLTSAALVGILLPGTAPLFAAIILFAWRGERPGRGRAVALATIGIGAACTAVLTGSAAASAGVLVLLVGGALWAVSTLGLRGTRLDMPSVVLVLCLPSVLVALALAATGVLPSNFLRGEAALHDIVHFGAVQGIGTGIVSTVAYATAVRLLGSTAATWGALSPVVTTLVAIPVLGEAITPATVAALALVVGGVVAYSLLGRRTARGATVRP